MKFCVGGCDPGSAVSFECDILFSALGLSDLSPHYKKPVIVQLVWEFQTCLLQIRAEHSLHAAG